MRRVIIESPYVGTSLNVFVRDCERKVHIVYARLCVRDSLMRGEAPIASHLLYTQPGILDDYDKDERQHGIDAGLAWLSVASALCVYKDLGVSKGMEYGIIAAQKADIPIEFRFLAKENESLWATFCYYEARSGIW